MPSRRLTLLLMGAVLLTFAAACGSSTPDPTATIDPGPSDVSPVATPTPTPGTANPSPTATPTEAGPDNSVGLIDPDPNYQAALDASRISTFGWETDFSRHTIDFNEVFSGGVPRDGIPPIYDPKFVTTDEADEWLSPLEPVIALEVDGVAKAYPLQILTWHEIANDVIAGVPVAVTFCPLCNSAVVFDRRLDGVVYEFGVSGNLRNSDLIMWDRQTQSWWQQLTGEGIIGQNAGAQLTFIPAPIVSWEAYREEYPGSDVLSRETGRQRPYGNNPYAGYDRVDNPPFLFAGPTDGRLLPKERVVAISVGGEDAAFPFAVLSQERAVNYTVGGKPVVVFHEPGTVSALDRTAISLSQDIGSTGAFDAMLDGELLTFQLNGSPEEGKIVDEQTSSTWNIFGKAVEGPLAGKQLTRIVSQDHFWFAWAAFKPDTKIYFGPAS